LYTPCQTDWTPRNRSRRPSTRWSQRSSSQRGWPSCLPSAQTFPSTSAAQSTWAARPWDSPLRRKWRRSGPSSTSSLGNSRVARPPSTVSLEKGVPRLGTRGAGVSGDGKEAYMSPAPIYRSLPWHARGSFEKATHKRRRSLLAASEIARRWLRGCRWAACGVPGSCVWGWVTRRTDGQLGLDI
ncbi:hypothetical protein CI238_02568, partial [Colletotrichum incanum]